MKNSKLATRYATAFFELSNESQKQQIFLDELKVFQKTVDADKQLLGFITSPLVLPMEKEKAIGVVLKSCKFSDEVANFILLLAKKGRLQILAEIIQAYQEKQDEKNQITRGTVRSSHKLSDQIRKDVLASIEKVTKKKVVLEYIEDSSLIGGLSAKVGSLTFDDSLFMHLNKINEELTRRLN